MALASKVQALALRAALTIFGITFKRKKDNKINYSYNNKWISKQITNQNSVHYLSSQAVRNTGTPCLNFNYGCRLKGLGLESQALHSKVQALASKVQALASKVQALAWSQSPSLGLEGPVLVSKSKPWPRRSRPWSQSSRPWPRRSSLGLEVQALASKVQASALTTSLDWSWVTRSTVVILLPWNNGRQN